MSRAGVQNPDRRSRFPPAATYRRPTMPRLLLLIAASLLLAAIAALAQTGTVKGRVVDQRTKQPISQAFIDQRWPYYPRVVEQNTDTNGEYVMEGVPAGLDTLNIGAQEYRSQLIPVRVVPDSETVVNVELIYGGFTVYINTSCRPYSCVYHEPFEPSPGKFTYAGSVRDSISNKPVPAAIVTASYSYTDSDDVTRKGLCSSVIADSLGRFVFQRHYPGTYYVSAKCSLNAEVADTVSFIAIADTIYHHDFYLKSQP